MAHVTFVHGIGNKPPEGTLLDLWLDGLATPGGLDLRAAGVTSGMVYWADVFYERPLEEGVARESLDALEAAGAEPVDLSWRESGSAAERAWAAALGGKLQAALAAQEVALAAALPTALDGGARELAEGVLLPWFVRERLLETLLRDAHHYFWDVSQRPRPGAVYRVAEEVRGRAVAALREGADRLGPHVVVGHGMGAVIAYDCLKRVAGCPAVDALVTLGSPLGLDEIQERLTPGWTREDGFPGERVRGSWMNVYDRLDPVTGFDPRCAEDYRSAGEPVVQDVQEPSYGSWRHGIGKYLRGPRLRARLGALLGMAV